VSVSAGFRGRGEGGGGRGREGFERGREGRVQCPST